MHRFGSARLPAAASGDANWMSDERGPKGGEGTRPPPWRAKSFSTISCVIHPVHDIVRRQMYVYTTMYFEDGGGMYGYHTIDSQGRPIDYYCFGIYVDAAGKGRFLGDAQCTAPCSTRPYSRKLASELERRRSSGGGGYCGPASRDSAKLGGGGCAFAAEGVQHHSSGAVDGSGKIDARFDSQIAARPGPRRILRHRLLAAAQAITLRGTSIATSRWSAAAISRICWSHGNICKRQHMIDAKLAAAQLDEIEKRLHLPAVFIPDHFRINLQPRTVLHVLKSHRPIAGKLRLRPVQHLPFDHLGAGHASNAAAPEEFYPDRRANRK